MTVPRRLPGMFWMTRGDYWNAYAGVWRDDAPRQPHVYIRAKDWPSLIDALGDLGLETDLTEDEVAKGHPAEQYPGEPEGITCWKQTRPIEYHWKLVAATTVTEVSASKWRELQEFLEELGVEPPEEIPKTLRQQGLVA